MTNPARTHDPWKPADAAAASIPPIGELVAHRAPALMLEAVSVVEPEYVRCIATIPAESPFARDGVVSSVVLLECMAQAVAAFAGLSARNAGSSVRIGFLVGCRDASFHCERAPTGVSLMVGARRVWGEREIARFECDVRHGERLLASASLNVAYAGEA